MKLPEFQTTQNEKSLISTISEVYVYTSRKVAKNSAKGVNNQNLINK